MAAAIAAAAFAAPYFAAAQTPPSVDAQALLTRVRAVFRAQERPPFVAYTLRRRDFVNGFPDLASSYTLRIWCRTSDGAALSRRIAGRQAGPPEFLRAAFDKPIDPGPPTADIFEPAAARAPAPAASTDPGEPPRIGSVAVAIELDYVARYAGSDGDAYHLVLAPRRDPQRNRLTDIYVDRTTLGLTRAVARDHLYTGARAIPERFDIRYVSLAGVAVIASIHAQTDFAALNPADRGTTAQYESDYAFTDVRFPDTLPAWYFEPAAYGAHRGELPDVRA